jgi:hypothetical protein
LMNVGSIQAEVFACSVSVVFTGARPRTYAARADEGVVDPSG